MTAAAIRCPGATERARFLHTDVKGRRLLAIPRRRTPDVTFEQACRYLRENFELIVQEAVLLATNQLLELTPEEVIAKARKGRAEYGGEFDVEAIPAIAELKEEMKDVICYAAFYLLQRDH